ncbi:uncharacterized protein KD926_008517 [Aspergillus affinis]|uniref:uncharacterized protein n=1 Tax=Aspergillus affinis TaxID=1070780 RepID=UPI0022FDE5ED|nr:uncharacterized protein KD926_008517 [Aspergillus affinis]KAI9040193.1 hypothetical protein KD926_008517 [Aspergillus affinis]
MAIPMIFAEEQQIALRPNVNILTPWRPVGLLLKEDEAIEVTQRYAPHLIPNCDPILTQDLQQGLFKTSTGHAGLITSLVTLLKYIPKLELMVRLCKPIYWQTIREALFHDPIDFFRLLRRLPFARGLPPQKILQVPAIASVLKEAIVCDRLYQSKLQHWSEELRNALQKILCNGWLHAENSDGNEQFIFASQIYRCLGIASVFSPKNTLINNWITTPLNLALDVISRFQPCQLADAPRSLADKTRPLEDQYQKEFYRCLFPLVDGHVLISPEFVIQSGIKGGTIDFLVPEKKWGLELLRESDRLQEHMDRFKPNGKYFTLIEKEKMDQYIVLNFTNIRPRKFRPEFKDRLYHVVFSEGYRKVTVIDASDLCEVNSFVLMEND